MSKKAWVPIVGFYSDITENLFHLYILYNIVLGSTKNNWKIHRRPWDATKKLNGGIYGGTTPANSLPLPPGELFHIC